MDEDKIEKSALRVAIQRSDGNRISGEVFLGLYSEQHLGSQNMEDLLNETKQFMPVKTDTGVDLLNIDHIVWIKIDAESQENDIMKLGTKHAVWVKTILGEELKGDIFISLEEGRARVKDHVNEIVGFFRLFQPGFILYINQKSILSIHD